MKVKALTNIKYAEEWHATGSLFDIASGDFESMRGLVETAGEPTVKAPEAKSEEEAEKPKRAPRARKM